MKFKAIIFDLDGTIIDTSHIWHSATKNLLISNGEEYTTQLHDELNKSIHGLALDKVCAHLKDRFDWSDPIEHLIKKKKQIAKQLYQQKVDFIPGFQQFYDNLASYNLKKAVATNADDMTIDIVDKALDLEQLFGKHVYGISCVNNICKPNPAIYLHAAEQLGVDPVNCFVIEDSAHGIRAAQAAGMYCVGINTSQSLDQVKHADKIVDSYDEIEHKLFFE